MKKILLVIASLNIFGNTVSLEDGSKYSGCDYSDSSREFICSKENKTIYVKASDSGLPYAIELDSSTKKLKVYNVDKLTTKNDPNYFYADPRIESAVSTHNPFFDGAMVDIGLSEKFILGQSYLLDESHFKEKLSKMIDIAQENFTNFEKIMANEKLVIEVDGKDVDCTKDKNTSCKVLTCQDSKTKDTYYIHPRLSMNASFLAIPSFNNKSSNHYPEVSKLKTQSGINLISRKQDEGYELDKIRVPSKYRRNPDLFLKDFFLSIGANSQEVKSCASLPKNLFKDMLEQVQNDKADANMVSLVKYINGVFDGVLVNPESLPEVVCSYNGSYYRPEDYKKLQSVLSNNPRSISFNMAQNLFDKAQSSEDIAWSYIDDGCNARAHLMAKMFEEDGVIVEKAWARGRLLIPGGQGRTWRYHVAPAVDVIGKDGKVTKMIIDPSVAKGPVTTQEWLSLMGVESENTLKTSYPTPFNASDYGKVGLTYSSASVYWGNYIKVSENDMMIYARDKMNEYLSY